MITAEQLKCAMDHGIGPLVDDFATPELKRLHDQWIDASVQLENAVDAVNRLAEQETKAAQP